jgi:uncharacterized protein YuzE
MKVRYYSGTDMLSIRLARRPSVESEEVREGFVLDFDEEGRVVRIEIDQASRRVDLSQIQANPAQVVDDSADHLEIYTVRAVADQLGVSTRAVQKTLQAMRQAGRPVGRSQGNTSAILLLGPEVAKIREWRARHPPGRPGQVQRKRVAAVQG